MKYVNPEDGSIVDGSISFSFGGTKYPVGWLADPMRAQELGFEEYFDPGPDLDEALLQEREGMSLTFAQFIIGLVEQGWITEAEGVQWLQGNALPASVNAVIDMIPESETGQMPQLRARAKALRPSVISRTDDLLLLMASHRGATAKQLDDLFRAYSNV